MAYLCWNLTLQCLSLIKEVLLIRFFQEIPLLLERIRAPPICLPFKSHLSVFNTKIRKFAKFAKFHYLCRNLVLMNKNNRKELLYEESFKLFMRHQFDGVRLSDIEKATGMTRGAIFYYHNNKLELFKGVVKHFFIDKQSARTLISYKGITLKEFINKYVDAIKRQMDVLKTIIGDDSLTSASKSYIILSLKLREYSEELSNEYTSIRNNILANWVAALQNAVATGEIKKDTDVFAMAEIFLSVYFGLSLWESFQSVLDPEHLRYKFRYLYELIKVK